MTLVSGLHSSEKTSRRNDGALGFFARDDVIAIEAGEVAVGEAAAVDGRSVAVAVNHSMAGIKKVRRYKWPFGLINVTTDC